MLYFCQEIRNRRLDTGPAWQTESTRLSQCFMSQQSLGSYAPCFSCGSQHRFQNKNAKKQDSVVVLRRKHGSTCILHISRSHSFR